MALGPDFDQRMSALRTRIEAMRQVIWNPRWARAGDRNTGLPGLVVAGIVATVILAAFAVGLL